MNGYRITCRNTLCHWFIHRRCWRNWGARISGQEKTGRMKTYGLIGNPVSHSWSANFFNNKFKHEGLNAEYKLFKLDAISEYKKLISSEKQLCGLNVTIPFKVQIMPLLDELSEEAKAIGAVNTIVFKHGKTIGYNTDAYGFF
jgi:shikimate dehydrogenase